MCSKRQNALLFTSVLSRATSLYRPDAVVCQCGADCLSGDPLGGFNLSSRGLADCVSLVLELDKPTVLLGGGGYNKTSAAIAWTAITARALKV